jgi:hypothetical protein
MNKLKYLPKALLSTFILVLPFFINIQFELKSLTIGYFLSQIILFVFLIKGSKLNFKAPKSLIRIFIIFSILLIFGALFNNHDLFKTVAFLLILVLLIINGLMIGKYIVKNFLSVIEILKLVYFLLLILGTIKIIFNQINIPFIGEPSFFCLLFGPISIMATFNSNRFKFINLIILFSFSALLPNATILLFLILQIGILLKDTNFKFSLLLSLILTSYFIIDIVDLNEYLSGRVTIDASNANLSSLMFLHNWMDIFNRIYEFNFFGNGIGSEGIFLDRSNDYSSKAIEVYGDLSTTSGTFWFARAIQTIGLSSVILIYVVITKIIKLSLIKTTFSKEFNFFLTVLLATLPEFFFRGGSVLSFCVFLVFIVLGGEYHIRRLNKI